MTKPHNKKWLSYQQASEWAQSQNIMTYDQWADRCAAGLPEGVPMDPQTVYRDEFVGWHEFLGVQLSRDGRKVFWSYERARDWARSAGVKSGRQWKIMAKEGVLPSGVPAQPYKVYMVQFLNWGEFLGTGHVASKDKVFVTYEEAMDWAKENGLTSQLKWKAFHKKTKPQNIPLNPQRVYKNQFKTWGEFLGTGRIANKDREFLSCKEVIAWAQEEGISSHEEWYQRTKKDFPKNIPVSPNQVYGDEFKWGAIFNRKSRKYFGRTSYTNSVTNENLLPYEEALTWARENGVCSSAEWLERCRTDIPKGMPVRPHKVYSEFTTWGDFLGLKYVHGMSKIERMLRHVLECALKETCTEYAQPVITGLSGKKHRVDMCFKSLNLIIEYDGSYWHQDKLCKDKNKTQDLLDAGWKVVRVRGMPLNLIQNDWDMSIDENDTAYSQIYSVIQHLIILGEQKKINTPQELKNWTIEKIKKINFREILEQYDSFIPYEEASNFAKKLNIRSGNAWRKMHKDGLLPNLPSCPAGSYGSLFKGWGEFLGTGRFIRKNENLVSYAEASAWAKRKRVASAPQWWELAKDGKIPPNIPASPSYAYKQEFKENGGWYGFLGKEKPVGRSKRIKN